MLDTSWVGLPLYCQGWARGGGGGLDLLSKRNKELTQNY